MSDDERIESSCVSGMVTGAVAAVKQSRAYDSVNEVHHTRKRVCPSPVREAVGNRSPHLDIDPCTMGNQTCSNVLSTDIVVLANVSSLPVAPFFFGLPMDEGGLGLALSDGTFIAKCPSIPSQLYEACKGSKIPLIFRGIPSADGAFWLSPSASAGDAGVVLLQLFYHPEFVECVMQLVPRKMIVSPPPFASNFNLFSGFVSALQASHNR